jgi:hypothetical protein
MTPTARDSMSPAQRLQPAPRAFSTAFGLLMVAAAEVQAHGLALVAAALAGVAVLAGLQFRPAATIAVLLTISVIVLSDPSPMYAALSGLCAAAYLVLRHAVGAPAVVTATQPTMIAAVGFTFAGVAASSFSPQLPWLPLLAPLAVFGIYALATRPFLAGRSWPTRTGSADYRR